MRGTSNITRTGLHRTVAILFAMIAVCGSLLVSGPAQASTTTAAVYCYGSSCAGRDPSAMGCASDAYTVDVVFVDRLGRYEGLELRYSSACNANWARLSAQVYYGAWVSMCVVNDANRNDLQCTGSFRNSYRWSPMIDGSKRVFASVGYSLDSGGSGNARTGAF